MTIHCGIDTPTEGTYISSMTPVPAYPSVTSQNYGIGCSYEPLVGGSFENAHMKAIPVFSLAILVREMSARASEPVSWTSVRDKKSNT